MLADKVKHAGQSMVKRGFRRMRLWVALLLAPAIAAGLYFYFNAKSASNTDLSKNTVKATRGSVNVRISASGTIRPVNQVKISPKNTGLLRKLYVQQGDFVHQGQILAEMDDSNLVGQVQSAKAAWQAATDAYEKALHGNRPQEIAEAAAQVSKYEATVRQNERGVARAKTQIKSTEAQVQRDETNADRLSYLAGQGVASDQDKLNATTQAEMTRRQLELNQEELTQAEHQLNQSRADLENAKQQFSLMKAGFRDEDKRAARDAMMQAEGTYHYLESQLRDTRIKAPFDGVVTQKYTDEGGIVTPTTSAATNSATSSSILSLAGELELVAQVSETDIVRIKIGQPVEITANAMPDRVFHGTVTRIAPEAVVTSNVTSFEVHATIDDDRRHRLLSGMNVNAEFLGEPLNNVLVVPTACVITKHGRNGVLVPDKSGNPEFKRVRIGPTSGTRTVIEQGLKEGDMIFIGLNKAQLEEQGYQDTSSHWGGGGGGGRGGHGGAPIPRGFGK